jgi:hypothetical protein
MEIAADDGCSSYYMPWDKEGSYYDDFEVMGQGTWWGLLKGCICPSGGQWADADTRQCTDVQISNYCFDVA